MDKSEVYPLVFIGLFIVFYSLIASSALSAIAIPSADIEQVVFPNYKPNAEILNYEVTDGLNSSNDGQTWYNVTGNDEFWTVMVTGYNDIDVWALDQGTDDDDDYLTLSKKDEGAWFEWAWDMTYKHYSKNNLYEMIQTPSTDSQLTFKVELQKVFEVSLVAYGSDTIYEGISHNEFAVFIGENKHNVSEDEQGAYDSFINLVTFNIPDMPDFLSFLIASPIYILGTYLIVRIILMFLPLVSGGA